MFDEKRSVFSIDGRLTVQRCSSDERVNVVAALAKSGVQTGAGWRVRCWRCASNQCTLGDILRSSRFPPSR
jgi:rRNA maturation endonuclease Nob1